MSMIRPGGTAQPAQVFRPDELPAKNRGGGARTIPLVTAERGANGYLNGITIFEPSAQIAHHSHNVAESVMVIRGDAIVDIDGQRFPLRTFDTTFVPANVPHHFENVSDSDEMRIFWTYGSLDATRTIVATGEHGRVDSEATTDARAISVVREVAEIEVLSGHETAFEDAVREATPLFQQAHGARALSLEQCIEQPRTYRLSIVWETIEDHTESFRGSDAFRSWRELIGPHLASAPVARHFRTAYTGF